jgi:hypothetical protein
MRDAVALQHVGNALGACHFAIMSGQHVLNPHPSCLSCSAKAEHPVITAAGFLLNSKPNLFLLLDHPHARMMTENTMLANR